MIDYKEPTYNKETYFYPKWAITLGKGDFLEFFLYNACLMNIFPFILGWCISATSLVPIPVNALYKILTAKSSYLIEVC